MRPPARAQQRRLGAEIDRRGAQIPFFFNRPCHKSEGAVLPRTIKFARTWGTTTKRLIEDEFQTARHRNDNCSGQLAIGAVRNWQTLRVEMASFLSKEVTFHKLSINQL